MIKKQAAGTPGTVPFVWVRHVTGTHPDTPEGPGEAYEDWEFLFEDEIEPGAKHLFKPLYEAQVQVEPYVDLETLQKLFERDTGA